VTLAEPDGDPVADGDGSFTQPMRPLSPAAVWARIMPATARDLERVAAGTVISSASHILAMPYHQGVTTKTVVTFNGRTLNVTGVTNPLERNIDTIVTVVEVVD
jgi:head-tail adaptor